MKQLNWRRCAAVGVLALLTGPVALAQGATADAVVVSGPAGQVTRGELEMMVREMVPPPQRAQFWGSAEAVSRMARSLYAQRALAAEGAQAGLDATPEGAAYLRLTREKALAELLLQHKVRAASPDDKALEQLARSEYKAHPDKFKIGEQVRARHILLPVAKDGSDDAAVKARAEALATELRQGADFAALAKAHSADKGSAQRGGDLGLFAEGQMVPEFEKAAFALAKPGQISAPVKTQFGYHIIELTERKPAGLMPLEQVLPGLSEQTLNKINATERARAWSAVESTAQVNDAALQAVAAAHAQP